MDDATQPMGFCPSCEGGGAAGLPCARPVCARRGYHHVPFMYHHILKQTPVDPLYGQLWGEYLVVDRVGSGGLGNVYLALQQPHQRGVALKVLHAVDANSDDFDRFRAEAQALARINHQHIVRLLHFGHRDETPFMVMELVDAGRTLLDDMRAGLRPSHGFRVLLQLVDALEAAHDQGVVHRDIKPANLMLQRMPGDDYYLRLVDFGLAKFVDEGSSTRVLAGTPSYMAPEQFDRRNIGPWTDYYALGALAFELLGGRRPFPGRSAAEVMALKQDPSWEPTAQLDGLGLPEALVTLLRRLLHADPSERPRSAAELRAALHAAVPEPVVLDARDLGRAPIDDLGEDDYDQTSTSHSVLVGEAVAPVAPEAPPPKRARRWPWVAAAVVLGAGAGWLGMRSLGGFGSGTSGPAARPTTPTVVPMETVRAQPSAVVHAAPATPAIAARADGGAPAPAAVSASRIDPGATAPGMVAPEVAAPEVVSASAAPVVVAPASAPLSAPTAAAPAPAATPEAPAPAATPEAVAGPARPMPTQAAPTRAATRPATRPGRARRPVGRPAAPAEPAQIRPASPKSAAPALELERL